MKRRFTLDSQRLAALAIAALLCAITGCGVEPVTKLGYVSGAVTLDGKPLTSAVVYFVPEAGPGASGAVNSSGQYSLTTFETGDGAALGKHKIYLVSVVDESYMDGYTEEDYAAGKPPPEPPKVENPIPPRYLSVATSKLSYTVVEGSNTYDVKLTTAP